MNKKTRMLPMYVLYSWKVATFVYEVSMIEHCIEIVCQASGCNEMNDGRVQFSPNNETLLSFNHQSFRIKVIGLLFCFSFTPVYMHVLCTAWPIFMKHIFSCCWGHIVFSHNVLDSSQAKLVVAYLYVDLTWATQKCS